MSPTKAEDPILLLQAIIARERKDGCPMASESLIEPALRRWKSYERRFRRHKNKSLQHRAHDLEKGLINLYPNQDYDPGCIRHLAESFAEALLQYHPDVESLSSEHKKIGQK